MDWRKVPSLAALRGFEAAARLGSLSRAAAELNVTHAAIAQNVRAVEDFVGTPLLRREGRGMVPTDTGLALQPGLTAGFSRIIEAVTDVTERQDTAPLRVTTTPAFAELWLMPRLVRFWEQHPDIAVSVSSSFDVIDLRQDGFDLALRYGRGGWKGVDAQFLVSADYIVVAAPSLLGAHQPKSLADLDDYTWLLETRFGEATRWAQAQGIDLEQVKTRDVGDASLVLAAVRAGAGVAVKARNLIAADLEAGNLVPVFEGIPEPGVGYHIVTRPGQVNPRLATFTRWLARSVQMVGT